MTQQTPTTVKDIDVKFDVIMDDVEALNRRLILDIRRAGERLCSNELSIKEYTQYCNNREEEVRQKANKLLASIPNN